MPLKLLTCRWSENLERKFAMMLTVDFYVIPRVEKVIAITHDKI
uniref:Uncharacterized protein n=1 Tax=Oryza sativa subsp. japonica TaxID=39947 RepID=Q2QR08_ORYSJ|nr:hypothetical protein LOC_Os12g29209 [Oryza sativa Japonica Group]